MAAATIWKYACNPAKIGRLFTVCPPVISLLGKADHSVDNRVASRRTYPGRFVRLVRFRYGQDTGFAFASLPLRFARRALDLPVARQICQLGGTGAQEGTMQRIPGAVLARWLPVWASRLGLGPSELAKLVNVSPSMMSRWWHGQRGTDPLVLAHVLNCLREAGALAGPGEVVAVWHAAGYDWQALRGLLAAPNAAHLTKFLAWLDEWAAAWPEPGGQGVRLPRDYVPRPALLAAARAALLAEAAAPVVLWGMAGVGKTVLATALGRDPEVRQAFWDGVLWATLGPAPDIPEHLLAWCRLLGLPTAGQLTVPQLQQLIAGRLAEPSRRYLLVLDDVWTPEVADLLPTPDPPHGLLITIRDRQLVTAWPGSRLFEIPVMSADEGGALLGLTGGSPPPAVADEVLALVEHHPLAVSLVGKPNKLRGPERVLDQLRVADRRLASLQLSPDLNRTRSVRLALQLSYDALAPADQALFRGLGSFPYGAAFALPPVAAFNPAAGAAAPLDFQLAEVRGRLEGLVRSQPPAGRRRRCPGAALAAAYGRARLRPLPAAADRRMGGRPRRLHRLLPRPGARARPGSRPVRGPAHRRMAQPDGRVRARLGRGGLRPVRLPARQPALLAAADRPDRRAGRLAGAAGRGGAGPFRGSSRAGSITRARRRALALGEWHAAAGYRDAVLANAAVEPRLKAFLCLEAVGPSLAGGDLSEAVQAFAEGKGWAEALDDADVDIALCKAGAQLALAQGDWPSAEHQLVLAAVTASHTTGRLSSSTCSAGRVCCTAS